MKQKVIHIWLLVLMLFTSFQPFIANAVTIVENTKSPTEIEASESNSDNEAEVKTEGTESSEMKSAQDTTNNIKDSEVEDSEPTTEDTKELTSSDSALTESTSETKDEVSSKAEETEGTASEEESKNILRREALTLVNSGTGGITAPLSSSGSSNGYDSSESDNIIRTYDEGSLEVKLNLATLDKYQVHGSMHLPGTFNPDVGYGQVATDGYNEKFHFKASGVDEVDSQKGTFDKTIQGNSGSVSFTVGYKVFNMVNNENIDFTVSATDLNSGKKFYASTDESFNSVSDIKYYPNIRLKISAGSYVDSLLNSAPASEYENKGENGTLMKINLANGISGPEGTTRVGSQELDPSKPLKVSFDVERNASMCDFKDDGGAYELLDSKYNYNTYESTNGLISKQSVIESYLSFYSEDKTANPREEDDSNVYHTGNFEVTQNRPGDEINFTFNDWSNTQHLADYKGIGASYFTSANMYVWVPYVPQQGTCFPLNSNINISVKDINATSIDGSDVYITDGNDTNKEGNIATTTVVQGGIGPDHVINLSLSRKVEEVKKFLGIFQANGLGGDISYAKGEYNAMPGTAFTAQASAISPEQHDGGFDATIKWDNRYIDFLGYVNGPDADQGLVYRTSDFASAGLMNDIVLSYGYDTNSDWENSEEMLHDYGLSDPNTKLKWSKTLDRNKNLTAINFHSDKKVYAGDSFYSQIPLKIKKETETNIVLPVFTSIKYYDNNGDVEKVVPAVDASYDLPEYTGLQKTSGHSPYNIGGQGIFTYQADTIVDIETFNVSEDGTPGDNLGNIFNLDNSSLVNIQVTPYFISSDVTDDISLTYHLPKGIELENDTIVIDGQECSSGETCNYESPSGEIKEYEYSISKAENGTTSVNFKFIEASASELKSESTLPVISFNAFVAPELLNKKFTLNAEIDSRYDMNKESQTDVETVNVVGLKSLTAVKTAPKVVETASNNGILKYTIAVTSTMDKSGNAVIYDALPTNMVAGSSYSGNYNLLNIDLSRAPDVTDVFVTTDSTINGASEIEAIENENVKWKPYIKGSTLTDVTAIKVDLGDLESKRDIIKIELAPKDNVVGDVYNNIAWFRSDQSGAVDTNTVTTKVIGREISGLNFIDKNRNGLSETDERKIGGLNVYALDEKNKIMKRFDNTEIHSTTDENGEYKLSNIANEKFKIATELPEENYFLTEKNVGTNNKIDSDADNIIQIDGRPYAVTDLLSYSSIEQVNELYSLDYVDFGFVEPLGTISLHKVNEAGEALKNAKFDVMNEDGVKVDTIVTDELGNGLSKPLVMGTYTVQETEAPSGYNLLEDVFTVKITADGQVVKVNRGQDIVNHLSRGTISLLKHNHKGETLANTEFTITNSDGEIVDTLITDDKGEATSILLPIGNYSVQETKASSGYVLDNAIYDVQINKEGENVSVNNGEAIINQPKTGVISLRKVDEYNIPLAGVEFEVIDSENNIVSTLVTDANGYAQSDNLPIGKYQVYEAKGLDEYLINETKYPVEITEDVSEVKVNNGQAIVNVIKKGQIKLIKTDEAGTALAGTEFTVTDMDNQFVTKLIVDEKGEAVSGKLPVGKYQVQETKALAGYRLDNTVFPVEIADDGDIALVNDGKAIINELKRATINLEKVDHDGKPLLGAEFKVLDKNGDEVDRIVTDVNGYAQTINLPLGKYQVSEAKAPTNYILDSKVYDVELVDENLSVAVNEGNPIINQSKRAKMSLKKVDQDNRPLEGVEFSITDSNDNLIEIITTNETGYASSKGLPLGDYKVQEIKTIDGYNLDNTIYPVNLGANGENVQVNGDKPIVNKQKMGVISLHKVDEAGKNLATAEFTITNEKNEEVDKLTTDINGYAQSSNLPMGEYTVKETKAPQGYKLDEKVYELELKEDDKEVKVNNGKDIINYPMTAKISLLKVDEQGQSLKGTEFSITNIDGEVVDTLITNKDGYALSNDLPLGDYTVQETKAVKGYNMDNTIYNVSLTTDGEEKAINDGKPIINKKKANVIKLHKVDQDGNSLANAEFTISNDKGEIVDTVVTDTNGNAESINLPIGQYKVQEVNAPSGYKLDSSVYKLTLDSKEVWVNDGNDIVNEKVVKPVPPNKPDETIKPTPEDKEIIDTGSTFKIFTIIGIIILLSSILYLRFTKFK